MEPHSADVFRTRRIVDYSNEIFVEINVQMQITEWNKKAEEILGWLREDILGENVLDYVGDNSKELIEVGMTTYGSMTLTEEERDIALAQPVPPFVIDFRHKNGSTRFAVCTPFISVFDGEDIRVGVFCEERSATSVQNAPERRGDAFHDALTGMPNRVFFAGTLGDALIKLEETHGSVSVACFNVDRFKSINDAWGHEIGDNVLIAVAVRLGLAGGLVRPVLSRLGGDVFLAMFEHPGEDAGRVAEDFAESATTAFQDPFTIDGKEFFLTVSVGIAATSDSSMTATMLLSNADAAMHAGKTAGGTGLAIYGDELRAELEERMATEHSLHRALERGELVVYYQPVVDIPTEVPVGVEALVRWQHPEQGLVPPLRFIPVAEESGLINPIGAWVLEESCRQLVAWRDAGMKDLSLTIEVNLSARQIDHPEIVTTIEGILEMTNLPADRLTLEITESALMRDADRALKVLDELKQIGVSLAIDDFGTGYSSLSYLQKFPLDVLKVDKSFVDELDRQQGVGIVGAVINLAHELELEVIAEGVETEAQLLTLRDLGCDFAQGYYFSRPVPAADLDFGGVLARG